MIGEIIPLDKETLILLFWTSKAVIERWRTFFLC